MKRIPLLLTALACSVTAQETDKAIPLSKVERKNMAPVSKEILRVKLPRAVESKLENGAAVMILEDHRLPTVNVQLLIRGAGGLGDPADLPGLASSTAVMIRMGTASRSSRQIAEDVEGLGANLIAIAGFASPDCSISASGLSENFDAWFAIMTDVLLHPSFAADELAKFKQRQSVGLRQQRTQPSFLASERFSAAVFGTFPAATVSTTQAALDAMTPETLAKWHKERYVPQNAILAISGDVDSKTLLPKLNKALSEWKSTAFAASIPPFAKPVPETRIFLIDRPDSVQTNLLIGNIALDRRNPDFLPLTVALQVLGSGPSGRLFMNLREEKGYTYGAYSNLIAGEYAGPWSATAEVRTPVTEGSLTEFVKEFRRLRDQPVPSAELEEKKRAIVSSFALSLEQPAQLLAYSLTRKRYNLPDDYWDRYPAMLSAVTTADVQRVSKKYIDPANMQIVAVGDATKIKTILEKFGPVTVYGIDGLPK